LLAVLHLCVSAVAGYSHAYGAAAMSGTPTTEYNDDRAATRQLAENASPSAACTECSDEPNAYMVGKDLVCDEYPYAYTKLCKHNANWAKQKFCQRSCFENGAGYNGDVCCAAAPPAPTPRARQ